MKELTYTTDSSPGYHRKGRGKGFEYFHRNGKKVNDAGTLERIRQLAIPPMWKDVWICKDPNGHLQATGYDAKERKQYLYHKEWSEFQNGQKFTRMVEFARMLPQLRKRVKNDLRKQGWSWEKVMALLVTVLDRCHIRIGNPSSMLESETYGLTTLRRKHLEVNGYEVSFDFRAKGGKEQHVTLRDRKLTRLIRECSELPGYEVFKYLDEDGVRRTVHSQDVNQYLQETVQAEVTAKDFRTWGGTVCAVECYDRAIADLEKHPRRKLVNSVVKKVAQRLNNTVTVCRTYYVHPAVLQTLSEPGVDLGMLKQKAKTSYPALEKQLSDSELAALYLMETQT